MFSLCRHTPVCFGLGEESWMRKKGSCFPEEVNIRIQSCHKRCKLRGKIQEIKELQTREPQNNGSKFFFSGTQGRTPKKKQHKQQGATKIFKSCLVLEKQRLVFDSLKIRAPWWIPQAWCWESLKPHWWKSKGKLYIVQA